ncbi:MAG: hypothetical protein V1743_04985 [Nanoarchaeota archaeon]
MAEIKITYETLFDILRREKSREELQKLEPDFFSEVLTYLKEKTAILEQEPGQMELFAAKERDKTRIQMQNIRKILKELFEKRENKIIKICLDKVRTGSELLGTGAMLDEEKQFFAELEHLLSLNRKSILDNLISVRMPEYPGKPTIAPAKPSNRPEASKKAPEEHGKIGAHEDERQAVLAQEDHEEKSMTPEVSEQPNTDAPASEEIVTRKMIRFIHPVPRFVGKELEVYGPFDEDEVTNLPEYIADLLVKKGRAEEISS